ncbi:MAG TPA: SPASM domain-containing protein [Gammaproteobacteria bacterium]|nr:SPASM domain-containing protein [Gammaproteobacteria bacterium]
MNLDGIKFIAKNLHKPNYLLYRLNYRYSPQLKLKTPVDVTLELASVCNQSCNYCYHADQENLPFKKGIMKYETAEKIILEAAKIGVHSIKFNGKGESTINKDFHKITTLAKSLARGSTFIDRLTNSNFKFATSREDIFQGLCNQTKVKISFDSFDPEVMEKQRAGSIHALAMKNIDYFYNHPNRKNTEIVIQAVRTKLNLNEDIEGQVKKRWPSAGVSIRNMVGGRVNADLTALEHTKRDDSERQSCIQAHARLIFNWDGKANACCPDIREELVMGHIKDNSVKEIFNSIYAKSLRGDLKSQAAFLSDPCKGCSSYETFKGYKAPWNS